MRFMTTALVVTALVSCGPRRPPAPTPDDLPPPTLLAVDALAVDTLLRQHVVARWATGETAFDAVVQKHGGRLRLVALSPAGQPGFVLELDSEGEVTVQNRTGEPLPFRAERILADVQKVHFPWLEGEADGTRRGRAGDFVVEERREGGRLLERRFFDPAAPGEPVARVDYEGWEGREVAPRRATLVHLRFGYALEIETLDEQLLSE